MRHVAFSPETDVINRRLPFFLALEEWVARRMPAGDYFFSWQVDPTVICGRNQEIDKEVNLEYCRSHGIDVVRRRSGGGCVFADRQNFMFSFITASDMVVEVFAAYTEMIAAALRKAGIDATSTGRNDITIGGKKVSGNAFYHLPGRSIAHGTMLYDFDPVHISNAITPSKAKLESKGVKSVPMRVTCLKNEGIGLSAGDFEKYMIKEITDSDPYILSDADVREVEEIETGYYRPSFLRIGDVAEVQGSGMPHMEKRTVVDGLGEFCVEYDRDPATDTVCNFRISGDFFMKGDVDDRLCRRIDGVKCEASAIKERILGLDPDSVIPGLTADLLLSMIGQ